MRSTQLLALGGPVVLAANNSTVNDTSVRQLGTPFDDAFVSYSIEFSSFPDYAGNTTFPNVFSDNLLNNIGALTGTKPHVRVGGNTQDYALYDKNLTIAIRGIYNNSRSPDYPTNVTIGPSFFESYKTWPYVKFAHGFNLALATTSAGWQTLLDTVPLACKAIGQNNLLAWEYGNEPDLYSTSAQGPVRSQDWNESTYASQWLNGTRQINRSLNASCPGLANNGFFGLSFGGVGNHLTAPKAWAAAIDVDRDIKVFSTHNYISGATSRGVTLQGTLLNHTRTMLSVDAHVNEYNKIYNASNYSVPLVFGETNSLYNQGKPGLSNSFGAALWGVDFNLYAASAGVKRVHMHQGTNYRYQSWQPITTPNASIGVKPPYYGNIAVAAFLGNTIQRPVTIAHLLLKDSAGVSDSAESAYAAFDARTGQLARVMVINMHGYNTTINGTGLGNVAAPPTRGSRDFTFVLEGSCTPGSYIGVQRLMANGSDAITGITWDGWSFNYELDGGKPVRQLNVTVGELLKASQNSTVTVRVPDSSAAILSFE